MDDSNFYLRLHVVVSDQTTMEKVDFLKSKIKELLKEQNVVTSTIEFEGEGAKDCDWSHDLENSLVSLSFLYSQFVKSVYKA